MTDMQQLLRRAFIQAINDVGLDVFKKTWLFMSNRAALREPNEEEKRSGE